MADSQVENFTALQTSSALHTVNLPSEGAVWQGPKNGEPAQAPVAHLPCPPPSLSFPL